MMANVNTPHSAAGASPQGAPDERASARQVREMFDQIASRYDFLNHVLSMNIDRLWWWRTARRFQPILARRDAKVLDLCCGTGDMALALWKRNKERGARIWGADFSHQMLARGRDKFAGKAITAVEADALQLPFAPRSFQLVVSAFGFRNLANYDAGLAEIHRVLAPGGEVGILDFNEPQGWFGALYGFYFRNVLPRIGAAISGSSGAYHYLPESVQRFPLPETMMAKMKAAGFAEVSWSPYSFGIAGLYKGKKS